MGRNFRNLLFMLVCMLFVLPMKVNAGQDTLWLINDFTGEDICSYEVSYSFKNGTTNKYNLTVKESSKGINVVIERDSTSLLHEERISLRDGSTSLDRIKSSGFVDGLISSVGNSSFKGNKQNYYYYHGLRGKEGLQKELAAQFGKDSSGKRKACPDVYAMSYNQEYVTFDLFESCSSANNCYTKTNKNGENQLLAVNKTLMTRIVKEVGEECVYKVDLNSPYNERWINNTKTAAKHWQMNLKSNSIDADNNFTTTWNKQSFSSTTPIVINSGSSTVIKNVEIENVENCPKYIYESFSLQSGDSKTDYFIKPLNIVGGQPSLRDEIDYGRQIVAWRLGVPDKSPDSDDRAESCTYDKYKYNSIEDGDTGYATFPVTFIRRKEGESYKYTYTYNQKEYQLSETDGVAPHNFRVNFTESDIDGMIENDCLGAYEKIYFTTSHKSASETKSKDKYIAYHTDPISKDDLNWLGWVKSGDRPKVINQAGYIASAESELESDDSELQNGIRDIMIDFDTGNCGDAAWKLGELRQKCAIAYANAEKYSPSSLTGCDELFENYAKNTACAGDFEGREELCGILGPKTKGALNFVLKAMQIGGIVLLIILGSLDFTKALALGEDDGVSKALSSFVKRSIAVIILFFIPIIIGMLFNMFQVNGLDSNNPLCGVTDAEIIFTPNKPTGDSGNDKIDE